MRRVQGVPLTIALACVAGLCLSPPAAADGITLGSLVPGILPGHHAVCTVEDGSLQYSPDDECSSFLSSGATNQVLFAGVSGSQTTLDGSNGNVAVSGATLGVSSGGTLSVDFSSSLSVDSGASVNFGGNVIKSVGTPVAGTDAANKAYVDSVVSGGGNANFTNLTVTGTSTFGSGGNTKIATNGDITVTNVFGDVASVTTDVGNGYGGFKATSGTDPWVATLSAPGLVLNNGTTDTVVLETSTGNASFAGTLTVGGLATFNGGAAVANGLNVTGGTMTDSLAVTSTSTFGGLATFNGGAAVANGLSVTGGTTTDTLAVTSTSTFGGLATFNGGAKVNGNTETTTLTVDQNATVGGTLKVTGLTTLNGGVSVTGSSNFNGVATFTNTAVAGQGSSTVNGGVIVLTNGTDPAQTITLNANADPVFTVSGGTAATTTTIHNGDITAGGNIKAGGNLTVGGTQTVTGESFLNGGATISNNLTVSSNTIVDMGSNVVHNVGTPLVGTDAANKAYVDTGLANLKDKAFDGTAISLALATPIFQPGQKFVIQGGWGNFEGANAVGFSAAGLLARNTFGPGSTVTLSGGVGAGTNTGAVAGRGAVSIGW